MDRGPGGDAVHEAVRIHRSERLWPSARQQRSRDRRAGAPGCVRAWGPPRLPARERRRQAHLADSYMGKRLNSPNDLVFKSNGDLYFTDPPYGLGPKTWDEPTRELDFCGIYRISKDGQLTLLTKELTRPNGLTFSLDEK